MNEEKKSKKGIIFIIVIIIIFVGVVIYSKFFRTNDNKPIDSNPNETINDEVLIKENTIYKDYENGSITTDEYVKYSLYATFDKNLLNSKYKSSSVEENIEKLIVDNYDNLSEDTLDYFYNKLFLSDVSFESKTNVSKTSLFFDTVYADDTLAYNLDKALLSSEGHFIVWYSTTGKSATSKETAQKIADGLEYTVKKYKELFGYDLIIKPTIFSKRGHYENQIKILNESNIDSSYLEKAMQVYIMEYESDFLAKYMGGYGGLKKLFYNIKDQDKYGSIIVPYIIIRPSAFNDMETLEQLYNHELFHHYQHFILCGKDNCETKDFLIGEAAANWASSLVSRKTNPEGYLNGWARAAIGYSDKLFSLELLKEYGYDESRNDSGDIPYTFFLFLNNYSTYVNNGISKVINSMYADNSFEYLSNNATFEDMVKVQESQSINNLAQTYENKNLLTSDNYRIKFKEPIKENTTFNNVTSPAYSVKYYQLDMPSNNLFKIQTNMQDDFLIAFIISEKNNQYTIVDKMVNKEKNHTFYTGEYNDYDKLYIVICNTKYQEGHYDLDLSSVNASFYVDGVEYNNTSLDSKLKQNGWNDVRVFLDDFSLKPGEEKQVQYSNKNYKEDSLGEWSDGLSVKISVFYVNETNNTINAQDGKVSSIVISRYAYMSKFPNIGLSKDFNLTNKTKNEIIATYTPTKDNGNRIIYQGKDAMKFGFSEIYIDFFDSGEFEGIVLKY